MKTILLIDDDKGILEMYATYFSIPPRKDNYQFFAAATIEEGRDIVKREKVDLVLLDLILPKIFEPKSTADIQKEEKNKEYGFNLLAELKKDAATQGIPIIILSNLSGAQDQERAMGLGAKEYVIKSNVVPSQVLTVIERVLGAPASSTDQKTVV